METSTSTTDLPSLVESDDELWTDYFGDYISVWLRNSATFIQDQKQKMLQLALSPFLFGVTHNLPQAWNEVLHTSGLLAKDRENKTTPLSEVELDIVEMAEMIFTRCSQLVGNKNDLKTILNFIYDVDHRSLGTERLDISYGLQEVLGLEVFSSMWAPIKRIYEKRKRQAHICIIYYFKIISQEIIFYGQGSGDKSDFIKRGSELRKTARSDRKVHIRDGSDLFTKRKSKPKKVVTDNSESESVTLKDSNQALIEGDYQLAVDRYSTLIEQEPFNSVLYSNRSQAYVYLSDYRSALCDCKRATILDPKNSLNYLRAAKCYIELGHLDKAEDANNQSLMCCTEPTTKEEIQQQRQDIQERSVMTKISHSINSGASEERDLDNAEVQYRRMMLEGCHCYLTKIFHKAADYFKSALDLLSRPGNEGLIAEEEQLVMWFAYGMSCVKTANNRNIQYAVEKFQAMLSGSQPFPAAYLGLGLAYMASKRFKAAELVLREGLEKVKQYEGKKLYLWPHSNKVFEEASMPNIKKQMKELLKECMHPPKPDAICKYHSDVENSRKEIYISDPDYKGHITIRCRANCCIEFHTQCWKHSDTNNKGKYNWKDMLDMACPTPGCWGSISEVYISRPDQDKSIKLSSQTEMKQRVNPPRPKQKMKMESQDKLERKLEKKRQRKERRSEARQQNLELAVGEEEPDQHKVLNAYQQLPDVDMANIDRTGGTLLRKDDQDFLCEHKKQKANKTKKKEKKQKQFLTLDVQFRGDENKQRFGVNSLDEDGDFYKLPPAFLNPGLLPLPEQQPVTSPSPVANSAPSVQKSAVDTENLDLPLYEFFYKILLAKGPIHLHSEEMQEHINSLNEEDQTRLLFHGGLPSFLSSDPRFSISQDHLVSAVIPGQSNVSHRTPQVNPWEVKSNKATTGPLPLKFPFPSLNPSAKEFVPSEASSTSLASDVGIKEADKPAMSYARTLNSEASELPSVLAENSEEDDGFTTVVNKKRVHTYLPPQHSVAPSVIIKNTPKPSSNYDSLDNITLDLPGSKQGQTSDISFDPSRSESQNFRKAQRIAMDLDPITLDSPVFRRVHEESESAYKKSSYLDSQYSRTHSPDLFQDKVSGNQHIKTSAPLLARTSNILSQPGHSVVGAVDSPREDLQRVLSPALSTNSGSSSGSHPPGQQPTSLRPLKAPSITLPTRGRKKKPLGHLSAKLHGQPASGDGIQSFDGYDLESVSSTTSDKDSISEDIRFSLADRGHPLAAGSMSQLDSSRLPTVFVPTSGIHDFTQGVSVCFEKGHSSFDGFKSSIPNRTLISPERSDSASRSRNEMFATKKDVWSTGVSEGRHSQDFSISKNPGSCEAESESLTTNSRSLSSSPFVQPQNPIRRPQAQSRFLTQMAASPTHQEKTVAAPSYWDYDPTRVSQEEMVTNPPSDPWKDQEKWNMTASSLFQPDLHSFSPFLSEPSDVSAASVDHAAPPKKATVWDYQHVLNSNSTHQEAAKEASKQFPDPWLDPWVPDPLHIPTAHHDSDKPAHLNLFPSAVKSPKEKLLDPRIVLPDLFHHSQTSNRSSVYASKSIKQDERWSPLSGEDKFRGSSSPVSDLASDKGKPLLLFSQWADVPNSPASSETPHQPSSSLPEHEQNKMNVESNIMSWMNNVGTSHLAETFRQVNKDHSLTDQVKVPLAARHSKNTAELSSDKSCKVAQTDLNGAEIDDIMIKVKEELRQKDIATKENVRLNDLVKSYEVQLDHERSLSYQLKKDLKKLSGQFKVAEMSAEKWREDYQGLASETEILKEDKQFLADEIVMLNRRLDTERMKVLSAQLEVLDLKTLVMVNRVDIKEQEANYHLQRLASVISQAQTVAKNLPDSVYEKHKEFTSYIKSCEAVRRQIEMIALRLKEHLKQGLTIDMTDLEFQPPTFPKPPNELIDRPQTSSSSDHLVPQAFTCTDHLVDYRNGSHSSTFNSNDSRTRVSSSTPKKVMRIEEDEEDDDSKAYLSMFYSTASSNSFVSVASNESLTETTKPPGSSSLHSARSKPTSDTAFYSNGSLSSLDHRPVSPARQVKPAAGSSFHSVPWSHQGSAKQQAHAAKTRSEQNLLTKPSGHHVGNNVQLRDDMPSFDRIVTAVQDTFPSSSRSEIQNILDNLRRNKGSLLGWGSEALTREVLKTMKQTETLEAAVKTEVPDQQSTSGSVSDSLDFMCSICQSEIELLESTMLTCGHRFHESCIERWLHSDRTCPNCRSHTLLSQEFPSLK